MYMYVFKQIHEIQTHYVYIYVLSCSQTMRSLNCSPHFIKLYTYQRVEGQLGTDKGHKQKLFYMFGNLLKSRFMRSTFKYLRLFLYWLEQFMFVSFFRSQAGSIDDLCYTHTHT